MNEMGNACGMYGSVGQGFGGEACGKRDIWKTQAYVGG
jgi:hypothetical protein